MTSGAAFGVSGGRRHLAVRLYPRAERAVKRGHPWIYAEGIERLRHAGRPGDLAVIFDRRDRFLAVGLYDPDSPIRIRVLHMGTPERIDRAWLAGRIRAAHQRRRHLAGQGTTAYRLVHGENDGLPGLVVDCYDRSLVVKLYTAAWVPHLTDVLAGLCELFEPERAVLRLSRAVRSAADNGDFADGRVLLGDPSSEPVLFQENGLRFEADLIRGQKTGFFLDQRENRALVEQFSAGKSVLDVFAYTGGFSLYAARGGARSVTSMDVSRPALSVAERNFHHNRACPSVALARHRVLAGDAFDLIPQLRERAERFDIVILDPPAFAKARGEMDRALRSYERILRLGLDVVSERGLLVAASCSSRLTADRFRMLVEATAGAAGRSLRILRQTGHAVDHPIGFPEGAYLKCIFATVGP